jgi:hypothetical protein
MLEFMASLVSLVPQSPVGMARWALHLHHELSELEVLVTDSEQTCLTLNQRMRRLCYTDTHGRALCSARASLY